MLLALCAAFAVGMAAAWAQTEPCANPPRNLSGTYVNNQTQLTWVAPEGMPDWLSWSNGEMVNALGWGKDAIPTVLHRYEPADLAGHGTRMTKIGFMLWDTNLTDVSVLAYQPDANGNLQAIAFQDVPAEQLVAGQWIDITLDKPVTFDPSTDLYVGYNGIITADNTFPFGVDSDPGVEGKGNIFFVGSDEMSTLGLGGITGNWLIRALLEDAATDTPQPAAAMRRASRRHPAIPATLPAPGEVADAPASAQTALGQPALPVVVRDSEGRATLTRPAARKSAPALLADESGLTPPYYNVYCGGELVGSTPMTRFSHTLCNATKATYTYAVEYVASAECTSARTSVQVEAQSETVVPQLSAGWAEYPNEPENLYYILASVNPVGCATGYVLYQRSKTYGESRYELGLNDYGIPYTGIYASVIPGDSTWISMAALYDFGNGVVESAKSDSVPVYVTCRGGAPVIRDNSFVSGDDVYLYFTQETLTHKIERNGEIIGESHFGWYFYIDEGLPEGSYTYRVGSDCAGDGNITWSQPKTIEVKECVTTYGDIYETFYRKNEGDGYYWRDFYEFYDESGDYSKTLLNAAGCDSIVTLHLTIIDQYPARVNFYGHSEAWASQVSVDYAHWEDNQWKLLNDEELSYVSSYGSECNLEQYYEFNVQMHPAAHRKVDNDSIIGFRLRSQFEEGVYTEWLPLPGYGEKLWYTASNLPGAKMFAVDADDTDHHLYYASLEGLSGDGLHDELNRILNEQKQVVDYYDLPTVYTVTDWWEERDPESGYVLESGIWDMYSDYRTRWGEPADNYGTAEAQATLNREHALPKSWWGHDNSYPLDAYSDVVHVIPTNTVVNAMRGAYPYSEVASPTQTSENGSKVGNSSYPGYSLSAFEPVDEYKGDLARIYFYMATCYAGLDFTVSRYADAGGVVFTYENGTTGFTDFGRTLFMDWAAQDPVSDKERIRNNGIYSVQGNRNPFVDLPGLEQYLWGDKRHCLYYIDGSGECVEAPCEDLAFTATFNQSLDGFTAVDKLGYQNWYNPASSDYVTMNGYSKGTRYPNEDWLVSPAFDLAGKQAATLTFTHVINYCQDAARLAANHTLWITSAYTGDPADTQWQQLPIPVMPTGGDWNWVAPTVDIPAEYLTDRVRFAFKYLSDDQVAGQWEIKNLTLAATCQGGDVTVGIDPAPAPQPICYTRGRTVHLEGLPAGAEVRLHDLLGRPLATRHADGTHAAWTAPAPGVYLLTAAGQTYKVAVE